MKKGIFMSQYFTILSYSHLSSNPNEAFMWSEDDDGYEKYGFLHSSSVYGCLKQIESEIIEDEFEINIDVGDKYGGSCLIRNLEELSEAKLKYASFLADNKIVNI